MSDKAIVSVLIVDDDEQDVQLVKLILAKCEGYSSQITIAGTCKEAIAKAEKKNFDVLLLDLNFPGCPPRQTLKDMAPLMVSLPTIVITGSVDDEETENLAFGLGADGWLDKNTTMRTDLCRTMRHAILRQISRAKAAGAKLERLQELAKRL